MNRDNAINKIFEVFANKNIDNLSLKTIGLIDICINEGITPDVAYRITKTYLENIEIN